MIELMLALMPEVLVEVFRNKTLKAGHIHGQSIVLQASCYLRAEKTSHRGTVALTSSYLHFFKGNKLEEIYRFSNSELSGFKKGFLGGFVFKEKSTSQKFTCGVGQPRIWLKTLKEWSRSSQHSDTSTLL